MRVLVCGGRDFATTSMAERDFVSNTLTRLDAERGPFFTVIHGCAPGADSEARYWAEMAGAREAPFRADWRTYGRAAGPLRNQRMLDDGRPGLVIAFPGGRGTADMVRRARAAGVEVLEPKP